MNKAMENKLANVPTEVLRESMENSLRLSDCLEEVRQGYKHHTHMQCNGKYVVVELCDDGLKITVSEFTDSMGGEILWEKTFIDCMVDVVSYQEVKTLLGILG